MGGDCEVESQGPPASAGGPRRRRTSPIDWPSRPLLLSLRFSQHARLELALAGCGRWEHRAARRVVASREVESTPLVGS